MKKLLIGSLMALSLASVGALADSVVPTPGKSGGEVSSLGSAASGVKDEGFYLYFPALGDGKTFNINPNPKNYGAMGDKTTAYVAKLPAGTYQITSDGKNACVFTVQTAHADDNSVITHLTSVQQSSGSKYSCSMTKWQGTPMVQVWH
jgi:opacity protein-like surface antigen